VATGDDKTEGLALDETVGAETLGDRRPTEASVAKTLAHPQDRSASVELDATAAWGGAAPLADQPDPEAIGSFRVLRRLGAGAMGVVYLAHDPRLDRQVAIKVPSMRAGDGGFDRLEREAVAMARLSHPNVLHVYEVGQIGDRLFIVMEYMPGGTLGDWLKQKDHPLSDVLDVFAAAGAGLAAAHQAGLVHRDFKPDNVFIAEDGRPAVADFGLARALDEAEHPESSADVATSLSASLDTKLTMTGAMVGTPLYMAPEQYEGAADERADQFAFCVAAYQAVCGIHPFGGQTAMELRARALSGVLQPPAGGRRLPRWLRRALRRGLAAKPEDRHPSMQALLAAIRRGRRRLPMAVATAGGSAALIAVAATTWAVTSAGDDTCSGAGARLAGAWDDRVRDGIGAAFAAVGPTGAAMAERTIEALDHYAADWVGMRTEACEATRVRGEQSEHLMDLRMACLDRRRGELASLAQVLASEPSAEVVSMSVEAVGKLTSLDHCVDPEELLSAYPPPASGEQAEKVAALQTRIDALDALYRTGQYKEALPEALALERDLTTVNYPPAVAEALLLIGRLQRENQQLEAEATLARAADAAARAQNDRLLALSRVDLVQAIGQLSTRYDEALALARWAETSIVRAGDDRMISSDLEAIRGNILFETSELEAALSAHERALELRLKEVGPEAPILGRTYLNMSIVLRAQGDHEQAQTLALRAREVIESGWGPDHPEAGEAILRLGILRDIGGDSEAALAMFREAQAVWTRSYGATHPQVASAINAGGIALNRLGRLDEAAAQYEQAYEIWREALGDDHPRTVSALHNMGQLARDQGRWDAADRAYARSLEVLEAAFGPDSPRLALPLQGRAEAALGRDDKEQARRFCERALALAAENEALRDELRDCLDRAR
jgi:eukaryotic-like serine/threonine-protein kinase